MLGAPEYNSGVCVCGGNGAFGGIVVNNTGTIFRTTGHHLQTVHIIVGVLSGDCGYFSRVCKTTAENVKAN